MIEWFISRSHSRNSAHKNNNRNIYRTRMSNDFCRLVHSRKRYICLSYSWSLVFKIKFDSVEWIIASVKKMVKFFSISHQNYNKNNFIN